MIRDFLRDEGGAAAAEYALLLAIIAAGMAIAAGELGTAISDQLFESAACIDDPSTCPDPAVTP